MVIRDPDSTAPRGLAGFFTMQYVGILKSIDIYSLPYRPITTRKSITFIRALDNFNSSGLMLGATLSEILPGREGLLISLI